MKNQQNLTRACLSCGRPFSFFGAVERVTCPHCQVENIVKDLAKAPSPTPTPSSGTGTGSPWWATLVVVLLVVGAGAWLASAGSDDSDTSSLDQRTCEIGRDIAGDFSVTDTFDRSRERIADLYSGYGEAASPAIAQAVRDWSSGMVSGDLDLAAQGIEAFGNA